MSAQHALRPSLGAAGEAQGRRGVRAHSDLGQTRIVHSMRRDQVAPLGQFEAGNEILEAEMLSHEFHDGLRWLAKFVIGPLEGQEEARARHIQQHNLAIRRILGVQHAHGGAGLERAEIGDDEVDPRCNESVVLNYCRSILSPPIGIDGDYIAHFTLVRQ